MKYKTLVLFDVDKTLITGIEAHAKAFDEAMKKVFGVKIDYMKITYGGRTEKQSTYFLLKDEGLTKKQIDSKISEYFSSAAKFYEEFAKNENIIVLNGVKQLLELLQKNNILIGLCTGNVQKICEIKMKKAGLMKYFKFGGYAEDGLERHELVNAAIKKAKKFGFTGNKTNVFVVGDTPFDINAGKDAGVKTIGVASGFFSEQQLKEVGADFVLPDLTDSKKFLEIILGKN